MVWGRGAYMTIEQTMQARRLRCWPGGTKFSLMVRYLRLLKELVQGEVSSRSTRCACCCCSSRVL